jgi:hypothetical protein
MKRLSFVVLLLFITPVVDAKSDAERWWAHIAYLADDSLQGRETGSEGHHKAADYVADQFKKAGLKPGGTNGYFQPVSFLMRRIVEEKSSLTLIRGNTEEPVRWGEEAMLSMRIDHAPKLEAPTVFVGYGLRIPEANYDDLSGVDLRGKIVVLLSGIPSGLPGPLASHYGSLRWQSLYAAGAVGGIAIQNPKTLEVPWERQVLSRFLPQMVLTDSSMADSVGQQLAATINPAHAEKWFAGSGHTFKEILDLANQGKRLPTFDMKASVRSIVAQETAPVTSENVVGILPGTDPMLKDEYVIVSAHLDHLGTAATPVDGDSVFNGAMDNASGIATLIETAAAAKKGFRRSVVFLAVTAEEKGLLGSRYFAHRPTVPASQIVANLNTDMFLPLFPMRSVIALGLEESDLAADLRRVAAGAGVEVLPDPEPERNGFVRSDQYSFIRRGVPALSPKLGFTKDSPEHEAVKKWRMDRYHSVRDDSSQPVDRQAAVDFNRFSLSLVEAVANRPTRPSWNGDSFFRHFAQPTN